MASKKNASKQTKKSQTAQPVWLRLLLALTLAPLVLGIALIGAWSLDITLIGELESQIWIGLFLILVSFTLSNLLQKKWNLFAGWGLLTVADFLLLRWVDLRVQVAALALAAIGMGVLIFEFYRQFLNRSQADS